MKKSDKPVLVQDLTQSAKNAKSATFIDYQGMSNAALVALRSQVRKAGGEFVVAKNTLLKRALNEAGNTVEGIADEGLNGPTAVIFAQEDEIAPLQVLAKSIKDTELPKLKFGLFNQAFLGKDQLVALSKLPGKQALQGQLVGALAAPQYMMFGALQANLTKLAYILDQRSKQQAQSA
jgi:large subunit ribosomal protein L10